MPDPKTPVAPAAPAAPVAAPVKAAPAAPTAPKAKPAAAAPTGRATTPQPVRQRQALDATKALKLDASPAKEIEAETKRMRDKFTEGRKVVELPTTPPVAAATVPEPVEVTEPAVPEPVAAPAKIKIGDKEYTPEELVAENKRLADAAAKPAAPAAPKEPVAPVEPPPSPEELKKRETEFIARTAPEMEAPITEEELDLILAGGKDAVKTFAAIRQRDMAVAVLRARKDMAGILNPIFAELFKTVKPIAQSHADVTRYNVETQFLAKHKDFAPHVETARQVAEELLKRFPEQVSKLSQEEFIDEVARQTDVILANDHRKWFPEAGGNWRTKAAEAAVPVAAPVPPAAPARVVRAPAPASPQGQPAGGAMPWNKAVAQSLRG